MKIFVTGGTGFIGTHLIRRLKETQYELYCLARVTSQVEKLEEAGAIVIRGKMPAQVLTGSTFPFVHVRDVAEAIVKALEKKDNIGEKYMIVSENMTFGDINKTLSDISGTKLPKLVLPDSLTILGAHLLTGLANLVKKPPILDMSVDQMRLMKHGLQVDGSKATRELGLSYMPIRAALEEQVEQI